jgi:predicted small lipoprotein YifL
MTAADARRTVRRMVLGVLATMAVAACGQRGPLELPGDARPVERLEPPAAANEPTEQEDERDNER